MSFWKGIKDAWNVGRRHRMVEKTIEQTVAEIKPPRYTPSQHPQHATDNGIVMEEMVQAVLDKDERLYSGLLKTYMDLRFFEVINMKEGEFSVEYIRDHIKHSVNEEVLKWSLSRGK